MNNCTRVLRALVCLLLMIFTGVSGVFSQQIENGITLSDGDYLGFLEYKPVDYDASGKTKYPIIVFLHGIGERGNGTTQLKNVSCCGLPRMIKLGHPMTFTWNGKTETFLVLSPQGPPKYGMWQPFYIDELIDYAKQNLQIDTNRIYLTGLSMGGGGTYRYISTGANKAQNIAAAATICAPCMLSTGKYVADAKLPVWSFHAADDPTTSVTCTQDAINRINSFNPEVKPLMDIWPTGGHGVWDRVYTDTNYVFQGIVNIYEWFLGQNKSLPVNKLPVARAGNTIYTSTGQGTATLDGSASTDADGKLVRYVWKKISGPASGAITQPFGPNSSTTVTYLKIAGTYKYQLAVVDDRAAFSLDTVTVVVEQTPNKPPIMSVTAEDTVRLSFRNKALLNANATKDPDGWISAFKWTKISGPEGSGFENANTGNTFATGLVEGVYVFRATATDNEGLSASKDVVVHVVDDTKPKPGPGPAPDPDPPANVAPVANAGEDISVTLPVNTATLDGSASSDSDGTIVAYDWEYISGPDGSQIENAKNTTATVTELEEGTYQFRLTVKDNSGAAASDTVSIQVHAAPPPPNKIPKADAGPDQSITLPLNTTTLDGSSSSDEDGTIVSYVWEYISGPDGSHINNATNTVATVTELEEGDYQFRLTVKDNSGAAASDTVSIQVQAAPPPPNKIPKADAGPDQSITLPLNTTTLDGSSSSDEDGTIVSYVWEYISGPDGSHINNATNTVATVTELEEGAYQFRLTVKDNSGAAASDTVRIEVQAAPPPPNKIPKADAGPDQSITLPLNTTTLDGSSSSDEDGTIVSYSWSYVDGPDTYSIDNPLSETTSVYGLKEGTYRFRLLIKDNEGDAASDIVIITVHPAPPPPNKAPVAEAGSDGDITLPDNTATLDGTASADEDGTIDSYLWTFAGGPEAYLITDPSSAHTTVTGLEEGIYFFRLEVTDNEGVAQADTVMIRVNAAVIPPPPPNQVPVARAGGDQSITLPANTVTLDGTASTDSDGSIVSYSWISVSGPAQYQLDAAESAKTTVTSLTEGTYYFRLQVKDNEGAIARDTVKITVHPAPNRPPLANAGTDIEVKLPVGAIKLNGSASTDPDGSIVQYDWSRISGPSKYTLTNTGSPTATLTGVEAGVYTFRLEVRDDDGATAADTVRVIVEAANIPPAAKTNDDLIITLPVDQVTLNGSASKDTDGSIVSYAWLKISGPVQYEIESPMSAITTVSQLTEGVYQFRLQVKDNENALARDTIQVTVLPKPNDPPVADAGEDIEVRLPNPEIRLNGLGSTDPDGTIEQYSWTKLEGPTGLTIINSTTARPSIVGVKEGTYRFLLTVTDNEGATATDEAMVKVLPATSSPSSNKSPVAIAGDNQTIGLPTNTAILNGIRSEDGDGTIAGYRWVQITGPTEASLKTPNAALTEATDLEPGEYQFELTVTDNHGATGKDTITVAVVSNLRFEEQITTYPNPVHSSLNIQATTDMRGMGRISIFDVAGVRVHFSKTPINSTEWHSLVNVSQLKAGVYYIEVTVDGRHKLITRFFKK